ncbi:hypothetical protein KPL74_14700 [Bacillus sp. NP157]|nr:hypothetical protein KPL74_14700 [Bacillus sp. NP157]
MRLLAVSITALLVFGASQASAQSRTVSTANMPKPGVSYISGPSVPERRETVSTGTLPTPARLYVRGQLVTGSYQSTTEVGGSTYGDGGYVDGGYSSNNGYYGGYYGGYPGNGYPGNGYPGNGYPGHGGYPGGGRPGNGHDHDHGRPGDNRQDNTVTVGVKPRPSDGKPGYNVAPVRDDNHRDGRGNNNGWNGNGNGWNNNAGWNNGPQPTINEPPPRPYTPGSGQTFGPQMIPVNGSRVAPGSGGPPPVRGR